MSALISSQAFVVLVPVRGKGTATHYVRRSSKLGLDPEAGPALCGSMGARDRYGRQRWRRVGSAGRLCNACHARACSFPSRVEW